MGEAIQQRLKQSTFESQEQEAILSLLVAASHLRAAFDKVGTGFGISTEQYNILRILKGVYPEGHTCGAIGERMIDRSPDITRRIDRLEKMGLVERARGTEDRRIVVTKLTPAGLEMVERITGLVGNTYAALGSELEAVEWAELTRLCEKLFQVEL